MSTCPRDFYMDGESGKCQSCAELCHQAEVRGTVELCTDLCPVSSDSPVPDAYIDTATTTSATEAAVIAPIDDGKLIREGVVITLAVVIILVSLAALVILLFCERIEKHASHRRGLDEDVEPSVTLNSIPVNLHGISQSQHVHKKPRIGFLGSISSAVA